MFIHAFEIEKVSEFQFEYCIRFKKFVLTLLMTLVPTKIHKKERDKIVSQNRKKNMKLGFFSKVSEGRSRTDEI